MKAHFICKASIKIGFGHLIRTLTVANTFHKYENANSEIYLSVIGHKSIENLLVEALVPYRFYSDETELELQESSEVVFLDLLELSDEVFSRIRTNFTHVYSLSPVFNHLKDVDALFHRSKYIGVEKQLLPKQLYLGLEYSVIQDYCKRIDAGTYERNLNLENLPIAISMGGGDAANKTLKVIKALRDCPVPVSFWVTLGEGYSHSYDALINEIKGHKTHEIILARTNKSMWYILNNCTMVILLSGITAYEAAYANLPSLIYYSNDEQSKLVKELFESEVARDQGIFNDENLVCLNDQITKIYHNRRLLFDMHLNAKNLIKGNGAVNIYHVVQEKLIK